jgi:hypothetical protein
MGNTGGEYHKRAYLYHLDYLFGRRAGGDDGAESASVIRVYALELARVGKLWEYCILLNNRPLTGDIPRKWRGRGGRRTPFPFNCELELPVDEGSQPVVHVSGHLCSFRDADSHVHVQRADARTSGVRLHMEGGTLGARRGQKDEMERFGRQEMSRSHMHGSYRV